MNRVTDGTAGGRAERTLEALQQVTDVALAYLPLEDLLHALLDRIARILSSDTSAILLLDESRDELVARAAKGIEEEVERGVRIPVGKGFAGRIAAERHAVAIEDVDHADILNPILRIKGIRSLLGVPLLVEGQVIGVLHVGTLTPRIFTEEDHNLLQLAADRAALAIERARFFEQRRGVEALQRALLPAHLPAIPGIELAARYRPSAVGTTIGGDWYDVFRLGGGRIGLVIGDVMGHGVAAAALMAELRTALRAYALDGHPPAEVAERMNRLLAPRRPTTMTTLAYLVLDPETESVSAVSAGHVPPLIIDPDGTTRYLDIAGDPPVGVSATTTYREHRFALPTGTSLVLVTDGAVEVRGEPLDRGLERLATLARREPGVERLASAIGHGYATSGRSTDDLAVLAVRLAELPDRLRTSWPAEPESLGAMRHMLRRWLGRRDADADEVYDITVAVQEACANAIQHAYAPGSAAFDVDASHDDGVVTVAIRDRGRWRAARGQHRGRGMPLMEALMESVDVQRTDEGTTIVLCRTIGRRLAT